MRDVVLTGLAVASSACHVVERSQVTRPGKHELVVLRDRPTAKRPTVILTETGTLRFVEPLECPTEVTIHSSTGTEVITRPNLATFVVGIVAGSVGAISLIRGASDSDPAGSPFVYAGIGLLGAGLPFAIGPWLGNRTELVPGEEHPPTRHAGKPEDCGERGITARIATIKVRGVELYGTIDREGTFAVSPYAIVDAFETSVPSWEVAATLDGDRTKQIAAIIDGGALATRAKAFLVSPGFDAKIEPMRLVPGLVPGALRVTMTTTPESSAIRITLPFKNDGPGPSWALRGHVTAPGHPGIDGRVMYIGAVAKGEAREAVLVVPVSPESAATLRNATVDLSVELRDAHGTAPAAPIRFRGTVTVDSTR